MCFVYTYACFWMCTSVCVLKREKKNRVKDIKREKRVRELERDRERERDRRVCVCVCVRVCVREREMEREMKWDWKGRVSIWWRYLWCVCLCKFWVWWAAFLHLRVFTRQNEIRKMQWIFFHICWTLNIFLTYIQWFGNQSFFCY